MNTIHKASDIMPAVMQEITNPPPKRPDAPIDWLQKFFQFELWDGPADWKGKPVRPQLEAMMQASYHFIQDVQERKRPRWLSLLGTGGAGKTYLAKKIWRWYRDRSGLFEATISDGEITYGGSYVSWPRLAGDLQMNEGYDELEDLMTERLTVLDEVGADRDKNGHVRDCLARLCSVRTGKWMVVTSNLTLGGIQRDLDSRISSRMLRDGSVVVDVEVPDFAKKGVA